VEDFMAIIKNRLSNWKKIKFWHGNCLELFKR